MSFASVNRRTQGGRAVLVAIGMIGLPALAPSTAMAGGALDAYLPKSGTITGHIVELQVAKEDQAISKQFQLAVQNNMDWFKHYVTANKAGEPLPYNPKMGVTQAQYTQLLHMKPAINARAPITITVRRGSDGSIAFASSEPAASALKSVSIPADETVVETASGKLAIATDIHQKDENAPFGVWNGREWAHVAEDGSDQPSAKIAFGKREPSGEGLFYYQVAATRQQPEQSLVVIYKLD